MSGALDGPAMFFGHKTIFFAKHQDATPRMRKVSMVVPNLIWLQTEYFGDFRMLNRHQIEALEQLLWP